MSNMRLRLRRIASTLLFGLGCSLLTALHFSSLQPPNGEPFLSERLGRGEQVPGIGAGERRRQPRLDQNQAGGVRLQRGMTWTVDEVGSDSYNLHVQQNYGRTNKANLDDQNAVSNHPAHLPAPPIKESPKTNVSNLENQRDTVSIQNSKSKITDLETQTKSYLFRTELQLDDIFIGVKTTAAYHKNRLQLVLDTWQPLAQKQAPSAEDIVKLIRNLQNVHLSHESALRSRGICHGAWFINFQWHPFTRQPVLSQTYFFTDQEDSYKEKLGDYLINTKCPSLHSRQALCCKVAIMYDTFLKSGKRWFCHLDDDNYLNVNNLLKLLRGYNHQKDLYLGRASLSHPIQALDRDQGYKQTSFWFATGGAGFCISRCLADKMAPLAGKGKFTDLCDRVRLPDDVAMGFAIESLLKVPLTRLDVFNSHLQSLTRFPESELPNQVTLSYYISASRNNTITLRDALFNKEQDPTRLRSLHCRLYPQTSNCLSLHQ